MKLSHYLITRFNVQYLELVGENLVLSPEEWLKERFDLFFKFCYPSIVDQTEKNFKWIIYFDVNTPSCFIQKFRHSDYKNIINIKFASTWIEFNSKVSKDLPPKADSEIIITTRLDCDDALLKNAISSIQIESFRIINSKKCSSSFIINFNDGFVYDLTNMLLLKASLKSNPFISFVNLNSNDVSVYTYQHNVVKKYFNIIDVYNQEIWLQIIHGNNLLNRKIGKPVFFKSKSLNYYLLINHNINLNKSIIFYCKEFFTYYYFKYFYSRIVKIFPKIRE